MNWAVEVQKIVKMYKKQIALNEISLRIPSHTLFGIIGADGAGKTTLFRILTTLTSSDSGSARVLSYDTRTHQHILQASIGYMPQKFSLYEDLTVWENLLFFATLFGVTKSEASARIDRLLNFARLQQFKKRKAKHLSGGMKQKLALSCTLVHTPKILFLDEPTTGVDPVSREEFWDILKELKKQGVTIVVSTPYMEEAEYCDELALVHKGEVVLNGAPSLLLKNFPFYLYRATSSKASLYHSSGTPLPKSVHLAYPVSGTLHIASSLAPAKSDILLHELSHHLPSVNTITPIQPRIEDLFFICLSQPALYKNAVS